MADWIPISGWRDIVDISLVAVFCWATLGYFRRTRARRALGGLAILGVIYFLTRALELRLSAALFQAFFAVVVLILVVVFQEDLRRLFEQLGSWRPGRDKVREEGSVPGLIVRAVTRMATARTGALIVLPGREPLDRHLEGGIAMGGRVSEPLLLSLFDSSSPGHDGAVLLRGGVIERFAVHLPLSVHATGAGGTRHAAALGLAERCDALCVVVSEERGTVSVARNGEIRALARPEDLAAELRDVYVGGKEPEAWWRGRVAIDAAVAAAAAVVLWMVFVPGSDISESVVQAPVQVTNLPSDVELEYVEPSTVDVTVRGLRRNLLLGGSTEVFVRVDAYLARFGRRTFEISTQDVHKPEPLSVVGMDPDKIRISLRNVPTATKDRP